MLARYIGPHKLRVRQNETTLGVAGNLSICVREASGEVIVVAYSDDVSDPDRSGQIARHFIQMGSANMLAFSDCTQIAADGTAICDIAVSVKPVSWAKPCIPSTPPGGVMAFCKTVFDFFGDIRPDVQGSEDDAMFFRASLRGSVTRVPEKLVLKRFHGKNPSATPKKRNLMWYKQKYQRLSAVWKQRCKDLDLWQQKASAYTRQVYQMAQYIRRKIAQYDACVTLSSGDWRVLVPTMTQLVISGGNIVRGLKLFCLARRE